MDGILKHLAAICAFVIEEFQFIAIAFNGEAFLRNFKHPGDGCFYCAFSGLFSCRCEQTGKNTLSGNAADIRSIERFISRRKHIHVDALANRFTGDLLHVDTGAGLSGQLTVNKQYPSGGISTCTL